MGMLVKKIIEKIEKLYGPEQVAQITRRLESLLERYRSSSQPGDRSFLTAGDVMLITYADNLQSPSKTPLQCLAEFYQNRLTEIISIIHLLPFFPYSSDDGFAVIDYRQVNSGCGDWSDIEQLADSVDLSFDLVINHVSAGSEYFQGYRRGDRRYQDFFIELDKDADTSKVLRPRTLPLLHRHPTSDGDKWCWTTFSEDQIDLNFHNPDVLLEMLDILLFYVGRGARVIRLDAIAYLWKEMGTSCAHLPQTHLIVQLMRDLLDVAAPHVLLLTETNVPHADNVSYFGNGDNEAQLVYNFPLAPLILHTLTAQNSRHLTAWAKTIKPPSARTAFLNFTASHDGIGIRPVADILDEKEFLNLVELTERHGGSVSCKNDLAGRAVPYELNINYFDALNNPNDGDADLQIQIDRFCLSQSIALVFQGVPAIYIHSLLGSRNWNAGVEKTGRARTINREKLDLDLLERRLQEAESLPGRVFHRYRHMIIQRRKEKAFDPQAAQRVLDLGDEFFALLRTCPESADKIIALHNVTGESRQVCIESALWENEEGVELSSATDLLSGQTFARGAKGACELCLRPYQFVWLKGEFI